MVVIKKDGTREEFNISKIFGAVNKARLRSSKNLNEEFNQIGFVNAINASLANRQEVTTKELHSVVLSALDTAGEIAVRDSYQSYRDYREHTVKTWDEIFQYARDVIYLGDRENANFDSALSSTKGSLIRGQCTSELYKQFYLSPREKELMARGDIYIHDRRDMILNNVNCCLFDIGTVLKGGFTMGGVNYTEPNSVLAALQVIGDITLVATAQQFGGFTLAELDKVLIPYCKKTVDRAVKEATEFGIPREKHHRFAMQTVKRELEQGFQSLELKLNTVPCSRGDFAFTTITFGHLVEPQGLEDCWDMAYQKMVVEAILNTRMKGHGENNKPVVFPKLVFLYSKAQYDKYRTAKYLFRKAVECSSKCMYPDFLSIDGNPEQNVVAQTYLEDGAITSPMGCRAYLSPWKDPETGKHVTIGRCNIGAVSLNLPILVHLAQKDIAMQGWWDATHRMVEDKFFELLADRMQVIRRFFQKRYQAISETKASTNPLAYTQGGFYNGYRKPDEEVGDLIQYMTASFGITALNETSILMTGKSLREDSSFAMKVLDFMNAKVKEFKRQDGHLYALYGTPAESLCGTQAKQYAKLTGDTQFGDYFTNSFHLHVSEDITPFEKQDYEKDMFHNCNGGHIQYVRIDNPTNLKALQAVILRGMTFGFYQGVNFDAAYCEDCGTHSTNVMNKCPHCGSNNLSVISRVCGYLGYSNINGKSRMNDAKMKEISERKSM